MLIQVVIRLIVYTDQFVLRRGNGAIGDDYKVRRSAEEAAAAAAGTDPAESFASGGGMSDSLLVRGIDNTVSVYLTERVISKTFLI
jgi:hypothetical protein